MFNKITIRTVNPAGWPIDFELKPGESPGPALKWLESHGYQPAAAAGETAAVAGPSAGGGKFAAEKMVATVDEGKVYWKVKGANFQKFGVTIWPEVLEDAGFEVDALNPLKPIDLTGWTAVYSVKENGQPKKILKLIK